MTEYELNKEIEKDMRNYIAESSMFLNENFKRSNKPDGRKNRPKSNFKPNFDKEKALDAGGKAFKAAKGIGEKGLSGAMSIAKGAVHNIKQLNADTILNKDTDVLHRTIGYMTKAAPIAVMCVNPLVGGIMLASNIISGKKATQEKRIKLYADFKADLSVVNAKLADLEEQEKEEGLDKRSKEQKYALIKTKTSLENSMQRLNNAYMQDKAKSKDNKYMNKLKYGN